MCVCFLLCKYLCYGGGTAVKENITYGKSSKCLVDLQRHTFKAYGEETLHFLHALNMYWYVCFCERFDVYCILQYLFLYCSIYCFVLGDCNIVDCDVL